MPWIEPDFLDCTVYLYPSEAAAEDGERMGGSGFLVGLQLPSSPQHLLVCVVTNRHVIQGGHMVLRINTVTGGREILPLDQAKWFEHPDGDDVVVCPFGMRPHHKAKCLPRHIFITKQTVEDMGIGPGDDVFVVGRFVNHEGKQRNLPSVRFGNIAQMPWEPIMSEGRPQESFLVEAKSIAGYSGSPVFVYFDPQPPLNLFPQFQQDLRDGKIKIPGVHPKRHNIQLRLSWLLGIDYCHLRSDEPIWNVHTQRPSEDWFIKSNTGMMGVVPAWKLTDILDGPEMKPFIEMADAEAKERLRKQPNVAELDAAPFVAPQETKKAAPEDSNPSHREDFKKLLGAAATTPRQDD